MSKKEPIKTVPETENSDIESISAVLQKLNQDAIAASKQLFDSKKVADRNVEQIEENVGRSGTLMGQVDSALKEVSDYTSKFAESTQQLENLKKAANDHAKQIADTKQNGEVALQRIESIEGSSTQAKESIDDLLRSVTLNKGECDESTAAIKAADADIKLARDTQANLLTKLTASIEEFEAQKRQFEQYKTAEKTKIAAVVEEA